MRHKAPQFELPGTAQVFNLSGELLKQPEPMTPAKPDHTGELFVKRQAVADLKAIFTAELEREIE